MPRPRAAAVRQGHFPEARQAPPNITLAGFELFAEGHATACATNEIEARARDRHTWPTTMRPPFFKVLHMASMPVPQSLTKIRKFGFQNLVGVCFTCSIRSKYLRT